MAGKIPVYTLSNGVKMPATGFGTAALGDGEILQNSINAAVEEGLRFFDTAPFYYNEAAVGRALRNCGVPREELFICTKLENAHHAYDKALKAFDKSMKDMGLDYLDLYLIHFPAPALGLYQEAWKALETLYKEGRVKAIGLSNFYEHHMEKIFDMCEIMPMVNELECNPYRAIKETREFCAAHDIRVINWFPLGGPKNPLVPYPEENFKILVEDEVLADIGSAYGKTAAQVSLRWAVQKGVVPIPAAATREYIRQNAAIFDFELSSRDMERIEELNYNRRFGPDPDEYNVLE